MTQTEERISHDLLVAALSGDRQALFVSQRRLMEVPLIVGERSGPIERPGASEGGRGSVRQRQEDLEPVAALPQVAAHVPEPPESAAETQTDLLRGQGAGVRGQARRGRALWFVSPGP
jgi:hypothetical protein